MRRERPWTQRGRWVQWGAVSGREKVTWGVQVGVGLSVRTRVCSSEFIGTRTSTLFGEFSRDGVGGTIVVRTERSTVGWGVYFECGCL